VTPLSVIVEFAPGCAEKLIEPVALTAAPVVGAPTTASLRSAAVRRSLVEKHRAAFEGTGPFA
jgi:hypothetical protein